MVWEFQFYAERNGAFSKKVRKSQRILFFVTIWCGELQFFKNHSGETGARGDAGMPNSLND